MKILIDARLYGLENAGLGRYVINLLDQLARVDNKNHYLIILRKRYFNRLTFPENWKKILFDYRHYGFIEQVLLPRLIRDEKPDLIHFPHFNIPILFRGKFVVTIHDLLMHGQSNSNPTTLPVALYLLKRFGYRLAFDTAVSRSEKIITPSLSIKKNLVDFYKIDPGKVIVTYEGLDEKVRGVEDNDKTVKKYGLTKPYFIYTGNAYPHKNLERAIEAILSLNRRGNRKIDLVIVSARNVFVERLAKTVARFGAEGCIKLLGFVPDSELGVLFESSVAFVFPSLSEGFGLPGLEAMSTGTLVAASDIPVFREIYRDNALYFNPFDFSAIEKVMKEALEIDPKERSKRIKKGQKFAKCYSWRKMAEETLKVYESCFSL